MIVRTIVVMVIFSTCRWADPVRECLADENRCNLSPKTVNEKPHMIVEMTGVVNTVFLVTVPGPAVSGLLVHLR